MGMHRQAYPGILSKTCMLLHEIKVELDVWHEGCGWIGGWAVHKHYGRLLPQQPEVKWPGTDDKQCDRTGWPDQEVRPCDIIEARVHVDSAHKHICLLLQA